VLLAMAVDKKRFEMAEAAHSEQIFLCMVQAIQQAIYHSRMGAGIKRNFQVQTRWIQQAV
jgi:hypothetical protein